MDQDTLKRRVAEAALAMVKPLLTPGCVVGVGTGSTTNHFIDGLAAITTPFTAVSSSTASTKRLAAQGISIIDLNDADTVAVYVDGADEVDPSRALIKGAGGALTREKIIAAVARRFICIVDETKAVTTLGGFPLPVEVIPMARRLVERALVKLGGRPVLRAGFVTDNGNQIIDVHDLVITDAAALETAINNITGVVTNGIFAASTRPDTVLIGRPDTVEARDQRTLAPD